MNDVMYPMNLVDGADAIKSHIQWANLIFKLGNSESQQYLSKVKSEYGSYLIHEGKNKYKWDFERIYADHPILFESSNTKTPSNPSNYFDEMLNALENEIMESKRDTRRNTYKTVGTFEVIKEKEEKIYSIILDIEEDEDPKFVEDLPITVKIGGLTFNTKVLDYDKVGNILYFSLDENLKKYRGDITILVDSSWILIKVKEKLTEGIENRSFSSLINRFIHKDTIPNKILSNKTFDEESISNLDNSQFDAFKHSLNNDISIIWGPPGTGKSHVLAQLVNTLHEAKEKNLIVCISNVAVDEITLKVIASIEKSGNKVLNSEILRIGHTRDPKILKCDYLFPDSPAINHIRSGLLEIQEKLSTPDRSDSLELKNKRQELQQHMSKELERVIKDSNVVFTTVSKYFVDSSINLSHYDNLIIDEASMLSIPHFIALGMNVRKRIIIAGDFRQLGPVVLSQSEAAKNWLQRDVFQFSGLQINGNIDSHLALKKLIIQRRSHESICDLINKPFYNGILKSNQDDKKDEVAHFEPFKGRIIAYKALKDGFHVEFTAKASRFNNKSAFEVLKILNQYAMQGFKEKIGILTPYRGQVRRIRELVNRSNYSDEFKSQLKIGTVHAFQGGECDVIIFDTVDSKEEKIGKLYHFDTGKRMVNVALSRAKHKLIVCGDLDVFLEGKGHNSVDMAVKKAFLALKNYEAK
jgi:superfamily I DNA and/or RNA helicase